MKKFNFVITLILLITANQSVFAQLRINTSGNVGIGTNTPTHKLDVYGSTNLRGRITFNDWTDVYIDWSSGECCGTPTLYPERDWYLQMGWNNRRLGHIWAYDINVYSLHEDSDERKKDNIKKLENTLDKVKKIKPVTYFLKKDVLKNIPKEKKTGLEKRQVGFIAQELETIFPEVVSKDQDGLYSISYSRLVPVLFQSINELQNIIDEQNQRIEKLESKLENSDSKSEKKSLNKKKEQFSNEVAVDKITLSQNSPNPFSEETIIKVSLTDAVNSAYIYVYNMQGTQIKSFNIVQRGNTSITIKGNELKAGMYLYSLIADGKEIDTKRMILTN